MPITHASPTKSLLGLPQGLPPKLPPKPAGSIGGAPIQSSGSSANNNQPGLLGESPATAAAVNALRGLLPPGHALLPQLPLSLPKPLSGAPHVRRANLSQTRDKTKTRKQP